VDEAAYRHYCDVRARLEPLRFREGPIELTPAERAALRAVAPLWSASPGDLAGLRRYGEWLGGARASDYLEPTPQFRARLDRERRRLLAKTDRALWIEEPLALGGFGFASREGLYNEDALRLHRVLSLLDDAAVLGEIRSSPPRRTVWEIGGGWGGFAYRLKRLCPAVTYLISGLPDLFLLSAIYLKTMYPSAKVRFYDPATPAEFWRAWETVDFAFVPEHHLADLRLPRLALTVDLGSLERMTLERAAWHVEQAYRAEARYFAAIFSVDDETRAEAEPVQQVVERFYWPHPVSAPGYLISRYAVKTSDSGSASHAYFLGWRRLRQ
jgi:hypothetical protein